MYLGKTRTITITRLSLFREMEYVFFQCWKINFLQCLMELWSFLIFFNDDGKWWKWWQSVHQATPGCFVPSWPSTDPGSFPTTPRSSWKKISGHPGPSRPNQKKKPVLRLPSLSCPERKTVAILRSKRKVNLEASEILMMLRMFKKKNILDTSLTPFQNFARHPFSTSKTCHFELSMSWVNHPICFPILSCWVRFKIQEISKNHWKIPLAIQSTQEKPASCAAAAAWDKDSERWKPHRIIERSMAFWVIKMRCLE